MARQKAEQQLLESAMKSRLGLYNYREILPALWAAKSREPRLQRCEANENPP